MRSYSMSFGMNKPLVDFRAKSDGEAVAHSKSHGAEYCVRTRGLGGGSMYTVLPYEAASN